MKPPVMQYLIDNGFATEDGVITEKGKRVLKTAQKTQCHDPKAFHVDSVMARRKPSVKKFRKRKK